jgi:prophage regulatory protein
MALDAQENVRLRRSQRKSNTSVAPIAEPARPAREIAPLVDCQMLMGLKDVLKLVGISRATLYRYTNEGRFPAPVKIGPRRIVWRASDLNSWFAQLGNAQ